MQNTLSNRNKCITILNSAYDQINKIKQSLLVDLADEYPHVSQIYKRFDIDFLEYPVKEEIQLLIKTLEKNPDSVSYKNNEKIDIIHFLANDIENVNCLLIDTYYVFSEWVNTIRNENINAPVSKDDRESVSIILGLYEIYIDIYKNDIEEFNHIYNTLCDASKDQLVFTPYESNTKNPYLDFCENLDRDNVVIDFIKTSISNIPKMNSITKMPMVSSPSKSYSPERIYTAIEDLICYNDKLTDKDKAKTIDTIKNMLTDWAEDIKQNIEKSQKEIIMTKNDINSKYESICDEFKEVNNIYEHLTH